MESTIDTQEGTIIAMRTQIKLLEEQIRTDETQMRLVKEDLHRAIEEKKEKENDVHTKNNIISKLEQDLEDEKRKNEEANLEMTRVLSDKEKIIMKLGEDKIELNNKVKRLEFKCAEHNENLRIMNIELADLKTEYTSYKVLLRYHHNDYYRLNTEYLSTIHEYLNPGAGSSGIASESNYRPQSGRATKGGGCSPQGAVRNVDSQTYNATVSDI